MDGTVLRAREFNLPQYGRTIDIAAIVSREHDVDRAEPLSGYRQERCPFP